jgi:putative alpha-1,2-mannosidase
MFETSGNTLRMKIGISFLSSLKARQNIEDEVPHWSFNQTLTETQNKWDELLKRIEVDADAPCEYKTMFYTGLVPHHADAG